MSEMLKSFLKSQEIRNKKSLKMFYKVSLMLGINFKSKTSFKDPVKLINATLALMALIGLCSQYYLMWYKRNEPFVELADAICTASQVCISILKLIYLPFVQHKCCDLLQTATDSALLYELDIFDMAINCKEKLLRDIKKIVNDSWPPVKYQLITFATSCLATFSFYMLSCIYVNYYYTYVNPQDFTLQLPIPALFPKWHEYGMTLPYYPIQYIITGVETYLCGMTAICFDGLFIIVVIHCSALFKILEKLLTHVNDEDISQADRVKYLICCVRLHERIYRYYEEINSLYRNIALVQCLVSILVLSVVLFTANFGLEEDIALFFKMMCFLFAALFEIGIYCYNGQKIITQSEKSPSIWYNCSWYNESKQFKYIINMMILRTNRTMYLQVSGFTTMSHITLLSILQTSASYFLLLKNLSGMD